ncbi:MAG: FAD-dependent oxidoreductase [Elainellaceae cyanobacterium]
MANTVVVAKVNDLHDGEMKQVLVDQTPVLLARVGDEFYASGANCTHYGAPLARGALTGTRVVCPWHNACFDVTTGEQQQPPGLDDLPQFQVHVNNGNVAVTVPDEAPRQQPPPMASYDPDADPRVFVVIGAGAAGINAVETLRKDGFQGRVIMVTADDELPYDRTKASKQYLSGNASENSMLLRSPDFYKDHDIEVWTGRWVTRVEPRTHQIEFADGMTMGYDALLLATGGKAKQLDAPGIDLENIFTLRSYEDADAIIDAAEHASTAVVIGSSFIGMEAAAALVQHDVDVTVISPESAPFEMILGRDLGQFFQQVHDDHGVKFKLGTKATQFEGAGNVETVILDTDERIAADMVVVGVGVQPATDILRDLQLDERDRSVPTDQYLQVTRDLYAAGDIARFPDWRTGEAVRIEHWRLAAQHGRIAAHNMMGKAVRFAGVPFFWTTQFDVRLRYVGHAEHWDEIFIDGDLSSKEFIVFYITDNQLMAAAGSNRDMDMAIISELMRLEKLPTGDRLKSGINWHHELRG